MGYLLSIYEGKMTEFNDLTVCKITVSRITLIDLFFISWEVKYTTA